MDTAERSQYLDLLTALSSENGRLNAEVLRLDEELNSAPDTLREENNQLNNRLAVICETFKALLERPDNKIRWIKVYRAAYDAGLRDSKHGVEGSELWRVIRNGAPVPEVNLINYNPDLLPRG